MNTFHAWSPVIDMQDCIFRPMMKTNILEGCSRHWMIHICAGWERSAFTGVTVQFCYSTSVSHKREMVCLELWLCIGTALLINCANIAILRFMTWSCVYMTRWGQEISMHTFRLWGQHENGHRRATLEATGCNVCFLFVYVVPKYVLYSVLVWKKFELCLWNFRSQPLSYPTPSDGHVPKLLWFDLQKASLPSCSGLGGLALAHAGWSVWGLWQLSVLRFHLTLVPP
jgi:hypothetical protein